MAVDMIIDVTGQTPGNPDESRDFLWSVLAGGPTVTLSIDDPTGVTEYLWEIVFQPVGASAVLSSSTAASPTFDPTVGVAGTYLIRCTILRGAASEVEKQCVGFRTQFKGMRIPAPSETTEYGLRGWDPAMTEVIGLVDQGEWTRAQDSGEWYLSPTVAGDRVVFNGGSATQPGLAVEGALGTGVNSLNANSLGHVLNGLHVLTLRKSDGDNLVELHTQALPSTHNIFRILHERDTTGITQFELICDGKASSTSSKMYMGSRVDSGSDLVTFVQSMARYGTPEAHYGAWTDREQTAVADLIAESVGHATASVKALVVTGGTNRDATVEHYSKSVVRDAFMDICAYATQTTPKGYVRIGYNSEGAAARPDQIRFYTKALEASSWTNKWWLLGPETEADWNTFSSNYSGEKSIIEALNLVWAAASGGGGVTLGGAYNYGGPGAGKAIVASDGAVSITVPDTSNNHALELVQNEATNNKDVLIVKQNRSLAGNWWEIPTAFLMDGTASQGNIIRSTSQLTLGHYHATAEAQVGLNARCAGANDAIVLLSAVSGSGNAYINVVASYMDMNQARLANLKSADYGPSIDTASFATATITVDWATKKPIQSVTITADVTSVDMSTNAPPGVGAGKHLEVLASGGEFTVTGFSVGGTIKWIGDNPDTTPYAIPDGKIGVFSFIFKGSGNWIGSAGLQQ